jgi:myosin protein heavy chain
LELRNIIGTQTAEIGSLISTLAEKSTSDTDAKKKNDQLTKTIEQLKSTNVELEKELETIKNQPSVVDEDGFNNLQEKNERLIQKITGLLALNNGLEDKIQLFRTENQGLTKILMTIKNLFQDDDKPITEKITSLLEQSDSLKSELKNFRQKNDTLRSNLTEAEKSVSEEKKSSETGDINHRKQVEQRNNKIRELEERIGDINKNLIECKEMNQKLEIEKKREQQNFEKKQKEFESLGKERDDERKDFVEVRNKMTGQRNENAQLLATIQQQTILLTTQENQISMMNVRIKELEEQLEEEDKLRNRLGECHKRIEETEETIRSLKSNQSSNFESRRRRKPIRKSLELRPPFNTSTRVNDQGEFATSTKNPDGRTSSTTALYKDAARNRNLDFMGQGGKKKKTLKRKKRKKRGTMKNVPK